MIEQTTEIECRECSSFFLVPPAERAFRREHGMDRPDLCPVCRAQHRANRHADVLVSSEQSESPDSRRPLGVKKLAVGGSGASRMYNATCDQCGGAARVPFVPRGDRPVYCRDCFNARKGH